MTRYELRPEKSPIPRKLSPQHPPPYPIPSLSVHWSSSARRCRSREVLRHHKTLQTLRGIGAARQTRRRRPTQARPLRAELISPSLLLREDTVERIVVPFSAETEGERERHTREGLCTASRVGQPGRNTNNFAWKQKIYDEALFFGTGAAGCWYVRYLRAVAMYSFPSGFTFFRGGRRRSVSG